MAFLHQDKNHFSLSSLVETLTKWEIEEYNKKVNFISLEYASIKYD